MRPKPLILLVLALGCGLVASVGINQVLAKRRGTTVVSSLETQAILVAMADIEMGTPLDAQNVKLEDWPKEKIPQGSITDLAKVEARRTRTKIFAGEPILEPKLLGEGAGDGATALIPKGFRVVSVRVDDVSGGASMILPGDRVDVIAFLNENPARGIPSAMTKTVLHDIRVFAVNDVFDRQPRDGSDAKIAARTVSLLVTPAQAEKVTLAAEMGQLRLIMRSREDQGVAQTNGALPSELIGHSGDNANREAEGLFAGGEEPAKPEGEDPLLKLLQKPPVTPAPTTPALPARPKGKVWTMTLIEGSSLREVEFVNGKPVDSTANSLGIPIQDESSHSVEPQEELDGETLDEEFEEEELPEVPSPEDVEEKLNEALTMEQGPSFR